MEERNKLLQFYPFLINGSKYRLISRQEIRSEVTYNELFPEGGCVCDGRLFALYKWQNYYKDEE